MPRAKRPAQEPETAGDQAPERPSQLDQIREAISAPAKGQPEADDVPELVAPEEARELPAPDEAPELPAPTAEEAAEDPIAVAPAAAEPAAAQPAAAEPVISPWVPPPAAPPPGTHLEIGKAWC